jgi:hypothetical protein
MRVTQALAVAMLLFVFSAREASADTRSIPIKDVTVIQDDRGVGRVLFRLDEPGRFDNLTVRRAILEIPYAPIEGDRVLDLAIHPVTTSWGDGVDWEIGWDRPGGDFDERLSSRARAEIRGRAGRLVFDLTVSVKEVFEGETFADGFIVTAEAEEGISVEHLALLEDLSSAALDVDYRVMTGFPPESDRARGLTIGRNPETGLIQILDSREPPPSTGEESATRR